MGDNMSLVLFTTFAQAAVGMVVFLCLLPKAAPTPPAVQGNIIKARLNLHGGVALAVALALLGLGVLFSLLHLSDPLISFYSIVNIGSSWLSREILFVGLFGLSALALFFARSSALNLLAGIFGIGLVFVMSRVYMAPPVEFWSTTLTFWVFMSTTFLLGTATLLLVGSILGCKQRGAMERIATGWLPFAVVIAAVIRIIFGIMQILHGVMDMERLDLVFINLACILMAVLLMFVAVQQSYRSGEECSGFAAPAAGAAILCWVGEIAGRIMFYDSLTSFTM